MASARSGAGRARSPPTRALAAIEVAGLTIRLDLPVRAPDLTLRVAGITARGVRWDGRFLRQAGSRRDFRAGASWHERGDLLIALDPQQRAGVIEILV